MEKTITIEGKEIRLNNNIGWTMEYRDQFNVDIVPTLMPMLAGLVDTVAGLISSTGKTGNINIDDLIQVVRTPDFYDALIKLSAFEFVDLLHITWAMAKTANADIPEPKKWVKEIGAFPIDTIGPELFTLLLAGFISSKNLTRLQSEMKKINLKPEEKKAQ